MCGRFAFVPKYDTLRYQFHVNETVEITPRYNIAPGALVYFLCSPDGIEVNALQLRWGLIPSWAKDKKSVGSLINARAESLFEKPAFRQAIKSKRGIMVMSGFYEWHLERGVKQPYYVTSKNNEYLAIAALWDTWQSEEEVIHSCCLITTNANELMLPIHHRMPVILSKEDQKIWMNNQNYNQAQLISIMQPYTKEDLISYPVTREMNVAAFDVPRAIEPLLHSKK
jgi:putative SOS response-associated peptidase YedK